MIASCILWYCVWALHTALVSYLSSSVMSAQVTCPIFNLGSLSFYKNCMCTGFIFCICQMFICFLLLAGWGNSYFLFSSVWYFILVFSEASLQSDIWNWLWLLPRHYLCKHVSLLVSLASCDPKSIQEDWSVLSCHCGLFYCFPVFIWPFSNFISSFLNCVRTMISPLKTFFLSCFMLPTSSIIIWL